jgi:hypothetical protein
MASEKHRVNLQPTDPQSTEHSISGRDKGSYGFRRPDQTVVLCGHPPNRFDNIWNLRAIESQAPDGNCPWQHKARRHNLDAKLPRNPFVKPAFR